MTTLNQQSENQSLEHQESEYQQSRNDQSESLQTIRFSFPVSCDLEGVMQIRTIAKDNSIVLYALPENVNKITESFKSAGFAPIDRIFKLHVSATSVEAFNSIFYPIEDEHHENRAVINGRQIYTVSVPTKDKYDSYISQSTSDCTVKAFRIHFANVKKYTQNQDQSVSGSQYRQRFQGQAEDQGQDQHQDQRQDQGQRQGKGYGKGYGKSQGQGKGQGYGKGKRQGYGKGQSQDMI
jgi:hypothetical protein